MPQSAAALAGNDPAADLAGVYPTLVNLPPLSGGLIPPGPATREPLTGQMTTVDRNPFLAGLGSPKPLSGPGMHIGAGGSGMGAGSFPGMYSGTKDPSAIPFSKDEYIPPTDPQVDAATKMDDELAKIQADILKQDRDLLKAENALGAKMMHTVDEERAALQPFKPPASTPPIQQWGSMAMMVAVFGSLLTRTPMTTAMNAMAGVLNGYRKGDQEAIDMAYQTWKANSDQALKLGNFEMQAYQSAMGVLKDKLAIGKDLSELENNEVLAKAYAVAGTMGDDVVSNVIMTHGMPGLIDTFITRQKAYTEMAKAKVEVEKQHEVDQAMADYMKQNPGATAEQIHAYRKQLENPYMGAQLDATEIDRRADLLNAGDTHAAWDGLPFGAQRITYINAIAKAAAAKDPAASRRSKAVQSILDWQDRTKSLQKLSAVKTGMQQRQAQAELAIKQVLQYADQVDLGAEVPLNIIKLDISKWSSDPTVVKYIGAIQTLVREYSGAINPNGSSRVYDEQRAVGMINQALSKKAMHSLMGLISQEIDNSINASDIIKQADMEGKSVVEVLHNVQQDLGNVPGTGPSTVADFGGGAPSGTLTDTGGGNFTWTPSQ